MTRFRKKRGEVGWPGPQSRQIERWCEAYGLDCDCDTAQTGTRYLRLSDAEGEEITVRVADHADAYCSATYTVDPCTDQRAKIRKWIQSRGSRLRTRRQMLAICQQLQSAKWQTVYHRGLTSSNYDVIHVVTDSVVICCITAHHVSFQGAPDNLRQLVNELCN